MGSLSDLARHWSRQTEKGKGIRLEAAALDLLNAHGVGELIHKLAAEEQRAECSNRLNSTKAEPVEASATRVRAIAPQDVDAAAKRIQRVVGRKPRQRAPFVKPTGGRSVPD